MKIKYLSVILLALSVSFVFSCKKDSASSVLSKVTYVTSVTASEDDPNLNVNLNVYLSAKSGSPVEVVYSTEDSSAISGTDYVGATEGKLTFNPGETSKTISIPVMQNKSQKKDVVFFVNIISATNATLNPGKVRVKIINVDFETLAWSDEFETGTLNTRDWNYELGNNNGWGNNEKEVYTNSLDNVFIDAGNLNIKAIKTPDGGYTSGRLTTKGKREFTYCKVEIRAKLPEGQGIWPALWMLGANISTVSWPKCGEIDIMELLGHQPNKTYATVHWDNNGHQQSGLNYTLSTGTFSSDFHLFTFVWTPNKFSWSVDNHEYYNVSKAAILGFPMDLPQFFIFNVAVGGNWPGSPDGTTVFPQSMVVDYIRVYK